MATATVQARAKPVEIPNKLYFRIGDVSQLAGVKPYVLRFWESEFSMLNPRKSGTNQRLYRRKDVEMVLQIKHLLYDKRFTIEGARAYLQERRSRSAPKPEPVRTKQTDLFAVGATGSLDTLKAELRSILTLLA